MALTVNFGSRRRVSSASQPMAIGVMAFMGLAFTLIGLGAAGAVFSDSGQLSENPIGFIVILFPLAGIGMLAGAFALLQKYRAFKAVQKQFPDEPWRWHPAWKTNLIAGKAGPNMIAIVVFAVILVSVLVGLCWFAFTSDEGNPMLFIILGVVALIGMAVFGGTVYQYLRYKKYGISSFELAEMPGRIGGSLGGMVHIPVNVKAHEGFDLTLRCLHVYHVTTGSGKNRSTRRVEDAVWETFSQLKDEPLADDPSKSILPVLFEIPPHCPQSNPEGWPGESYIWRLTAEAETVGIDYKAQFEVPIFRIG